LTQNPSINTFCVVCNKLTVRSANLKTRYNIIKPDWLVSCKKKNKLLPWGPLHTISLLPSALQNMKTDYDKYGDSFTELNDLKDLETILESMKKQEVSINDKLEMEAELMEHDEPYNMFSRMVAYIDGGNEDDLLEQKIILYGGKVVHQFTEDVTHIINVGETDIEDGKYGPNVSVKSIEWVESMIANKVL